MSKQDNKTKLPDFTITEEGYMNDEMKKKYEEIMSRKKQVVSLKKRGK